MQAAPLTRNALLGVLTVIWKATMLIRSLRPTDFEGNIDDPRKCSSEPGKEAATFVHCIAAEELPA